MRLKSTTSKPKYDPEEVLYQGTVKFSCWEEQGKKCRDRCIVLRRDFKVEIHDSMETLSRGCAPKLVLQPAGGIVFTSEEESRAYLEKSCAAILNGVKEDSSSVASSSDESVYLHLPHTGHSCFLFQQEEERDRFLSGLKTCIRHRNLDSWRDSSHESQAFARAFCLYQQDKGCYESWEKLLGTEEQVLASQVMEEVLPWLHSQLQSKVKGKKTERIRQWLATVQATYTLVLEQLTAALEVQREECRQTASASQALIRSNLDQILSSHSFLEQKVRVCICEEAKEVCSESVIPYMSSILEVLTEHIGAGILGMQHTLKTQMNSAFSVTNGTEDTQKVLSSLRSVSLDQNYRQVENLSEKLEALKQRFGLSSAQRLVHSAQLEMEQLLDSAVYTLEQFLQSSTRLQSSQVPVKMEKAKERVLKQLDHDSRVVQRRLYLEALLNVTLPSLTRRMDSKWKTELQQFEQYIFSDYSSFILVQNVYSDVLRNILSKEIETVVQDAASKKSNNLLLDTSDLAISQYSLLGHTPPLSAPDSPAAHPRPSSSVVKEESKTPDASPQNDAKPKDETKFDPSEALSSTQKPESPVIIVTQQVDENPETGEEDKVGSDAQSAATDSAAAESESGSDGAASQGVDTTESLPEPRSTDPESTTPDSTDPGSTTPPSPVPGSTTPDSTDPDSTDPGSTTLASPDPGSTSPASPDPESTTLVSPVPESTTLASPDPGSTPPPSPFPESTPPPSPFPESTTPPSTDPESTSPASPVTGSTTPASTEPESATPASTDPGSTSPASPDPESTTPASTEPESATPPSPVPGSTTPDSHDQGSTTPAPPVPGSTDPESTTPASHDPGPLVSVQSNVEAECSQSGDSTSPGNPATPDLSTSDQISEDPPSPSHSPGTDGPIRISLGSLSEAIAPCSLEPAEMQAQQNTDRAIYLMGQIKDDWEKAKEGKQKEAAEREETTESREEDEGRVEAQTDESVDEGCRSCAPPGETAITSTTEPGGTEERLDDEGGAELDGEKQKDDEVEAAEKEQKDPEEEVLQNPEAAESDPESADELPLGSVAIIRELVTEITEVETIITTGGPKDPLD
ncbi:protein Niban 1 isoform X2 [Kryptolebias marmoratus]|uniref:protein Niban 1 isoform X2 n=1 Tax=Kryptolebias marmoratus TaxID=37003 RepID=UPI0018ACAE18|nr:protein Niban 1 isoform X2 [Kryptolebias marmoratus]XP_037837932.1 protein Niban 1 isoform X2 [Kryptolebias marmoratus]